MNINFEKLRQHGFLVELEKSKSRDADPGKPAIIGVHIGGAPPTEEQLDVGRAFCASLDLSEADTEQVIGFALDTGMWSAIRRVCS